MDEDTYLERLRSIRQKYGCQKTYQYLPKNNQVLYPLTQTRNQSPQRKTYQELPFSAYSPYNQEQQHFDFSREKARVESKPERNFVSVDRQKLRDIDRPDRTPLALKGRQLSEAQLKRQDNFNNFIDDLDKRISQKEKIINEKFKENQIILRKAEFQTPDRSQQIKRSESHREIRGDALQSKLNYNYNTPRQAYDKSSSIKRRYERQLENVQNEVSAKIVWNESPSKRKVRDYDQIKVRDYDRMIKDAPKKLILTPSRDLVSRKLEGNSMIGKDGFSTQKLQSIQQRIQSVLRQTNR